MARAPAPTANSVASRSPPATPPEVLSITTSVQPTGRGNRAFRQPCWRRSDSTVAAPRRTIATRSIPCARWCSDRKAAADILFVELLSPAVEHDVTAAISNSGLQIASAHVTTYGVRAVDVFYVKDVFGLKVENDRKLAALRESLLKALDSPDEVPAAEAEANEAISRVRRRRTAAA